MKLKWNLHIENLKEVLDSLYEKYDFTDLQTALEKYHEDVEKHYEEFLETNRVWKKLKKRFKEC